MGPHPAGLAGAQVDRVDPLAVLGRRAPARAAGTAAPVAAAALQARGHQVLEIPLTSGLQVLAREPGGWAGGAYHCAGATTCGLGGSAT